MKRSIPLLTFTGAAIGLGAAAPAMAADLDVNFTIPTQKVAEYHAPYISIWIENADGTSAGTLAVWYKPNHEKWLKDMRKWWRKAGREMTFPNADGISGATHAPGPQKVSFSDAKGPLKGLKPGQYNLVIDAAREAGGFESVSVPFSWGKPGKTAGKGASELGAVSVTVK
ncbi:DUF2271 domain-containing protein [uncultured Caulobacter sp.]|uniref:DUF2271 domain-containing protein n=1 Tax=uncultured Caulobacter sp. TaxID=158749 RepID=UPI00262FCCD8|nr:DUF2271 domain-containing protein [uncultured Caulobacter sp.]